MRSLQIDALETGGKITFGIAAEEFDGVAIAFGVAATARWGCRIPFPGLRYNTMFWNCKGG